jgi:hypothetical protein
MNKRHLAIMLLSFPVLANAQVADPNSAPPSAAAEPPAPPPESAPPPPLVSPEPPPQGAPAGPPQAETIAAPPTDGQWVYTGQYGWVWMPYGAQYTYLPAGGAAPDMYVYYPAFGWRWVVAPWVWGLGPQPYFGVYGVVRFTWWGRGFGRWYGFAPRYVGWGGRGYWAGGRWAAPRAAFAAPHVVARAPARFGAGGGHGGGHGHR